MEKAFHDLSFAELLQAGGPGSGRHAGGAAVHEMAKKFGFEHKGSREMPMGDSSYTFHKYVHPDTGHKLSVNENPDGSASWRLSKEGQTIGMGNSKDMLPAQKKLSK